MSAAAGATFVPRLLERTAATARVALVAGGAMILGGDRIGLDVRVGPGCGLELVEVGGTVAYDADGRSSSWITDVTLDDGAWLVWRGLETVIADGADLHRCTRLTLAAGARAAVRDVVVLGRSGERGGRVHLETVVDVDGRPLLVESVDATGDHREPGVLGDHRVMESILIAGARPDDVSEPHTMALAGPGALARTLGSAVHDSPLEDTWNAWTSLATT